MATDQVKVDFVTVDVFTNKRYEGNPLGIVKVPKSKPLTQDQKQSIAREFNLSETTFLHEPSAENTWTVDIFMTTQELPFAGHPTIGTACHVLSEVAEKSGSKEGVINGVFNIKAGKIDLEYDVGKNRARAAIPHDVHIHKKTWGKDDLAKVQPLLARTSPLKDGYPIVSIVKGMTFVLVELDNLEALGQVSTTSQTIQIDGLDEGWDKTFVGTYYFARLPDKEDGTKVVRSRMIEGTLEDPATGSAASDLGAYLSLTEGKPGQTLRYDIIQGVEMGRRSEIGIEVVLGEGSGIANLYLEGSAVQVMEGSLSA